MQCCFLYTIFRDLANNIQSNLVWISILLFKRTTTNSCFKANKEKRKVIFKRAESYVKEYLAKERDEIRLAREAKANNSFYVPAEAKLAFVIRIKGYVYFFSALLIYSLVSTRLLQNQERFSNFCVLPRSTLELLSV